MKSQSTAASVLIIAVFAGLSLASASSKSKSSSADGGGAASAVAVAAPKDAVVVGSCDRSDTFYLDCTESFPPDTVKKVKEQCSTLGGRFREAKCPRINAVTACYQGNPPYLSGGFAYEGSKHPSKAEDCPRGFIDLAKAPELKPSAAAASCNALAKAGECMQFSEVSAKTERSCLDSGGELKVPAEPCPVGNELAAFKIEDTTFRFYSTPYTSMGVTATNTLDEVALLCGLAGSKCTKVPFGTAAASPASAAKGQKPAAAAAPSAKKKK